MKYSAYIKPRQRTIVGLPLPKSFYLKRLKRFLLFFLPFPIVGILLFILYKTIISSSLLNVTDKKIEIYGTGSFINEQIFKDRLYSYILNKNIMKIDLVSLEHNLLSDFHTIKSVSIKRKIPPHLIVTIQERTPSFAVYRENKDEALMVDSEGFVLSRINDKYKDLFKVQYLVDVKIGEFINADVVKIYQDILAGIDDANLTLDHVSFDNDSTLVYLSNSVVVTLSNKKGVQDSFKIVSSILDKLNGESKKVTRIDLRFDKVIVSYD